MLALLANLGRYGTVLDWTVVKRSAWKSVATDLRRHMRLKSGVYHLSTAL